MAAPHPPCSHVLSGILFARKTCGAPTLSNCVRCGDSICAQHSHVTGKGIFCQSCHAHSEDDETGDGDHDDSADSDDGLLAPADRAGLTRGKDQLARTDEANDDAGFDAS